MLRADAMDGQHLRRLPTPAVEQDQARAPFPDVARQGGTRVRRRWISPQQDAAPLDFLQIAAARRWAATSLPGGRPFRAPPPRWREVTCAGGLPCSLHGRFRALRGAPCNRRRLSRELEIGDSTLARAGGVSPVHDSELSHRIPLQRPRWRRIRWAVEARVWRPGFSLST